MIRHATIVRVIALTVVLALPACHSVPVERSPLPVLTMMDALRVADANTALVDGTIRAVGSVDGYFSHEGRQRNYSLDGVLFFLQPDFVRFDLKKLGDRQLLFGSNQQQFWIYSKQDDDYFCGRQGEGGDVPGELPIRPDQIADALGLRMIGDLRLGGGADLVHRVVDDVQQILILVRNEMGELVLEKEYWLDRFEPRLVRRVIFRDADGKVVLTSDLSDYRVITPGGPMLAYDMTAEWPGSDARMHFRVNKWELIPQVGPTGPQFATPSECQR